MPHIFDFLVYFFLLVFIALFFILGKWKKSFQNPALYISKFNAFAEPTPHTFKGKHALLPDRLEKAALILFLIAFIDPYIQIKRSAVDTKNPTQGIAIYVVADVSGSMSEKTSSVSAKRTPSQMTKVELEKKVARDFVAGNPEASLGGRPNDLIGLITLARSAQVIVPLTLDHENVLQGIDNLKVVEDKTQDGTALGYAIYKAVNVMAATKHYSELSKDALPSYDILSNVVLVITDGFQDPNPLDKNNPLRNIGLVEAAEYAKEKKVRLFIVNVEPAFSSSEFTPHRHLMERITQTASGKFYMITDTIHLKQVYEALNNLETSILPETALDQVQIAEEQNMKLYRRFYFYPYLIAAGMILVLVSTLFRSLYFRVVP